MNYKRLCDWIGKGLIGIAFIGILFVHSYYCTSFAYRGPSMWFSLAVFLTNIAGFILICLINYGDRK